jgi:hypothetical protein
MWLLDCPIFRLLTRTAPLLDAIHLPPEVKIMNRSLYPSQSPSLRGAWTTHPRKDAVWNLWEITRVYAITADQIRALGKDLTTAIKLEVRLLH